MLNPLCATGIHWIPYPLCVEAFTNASLLMTGVVGKKKIIIDSFRPESHCGQVCPQNPHTYWDLWVTGCIKAMERLRGGINTLQCINQLFKAKQFAPIFQDMEFHFPSFTPASIHATSAQPPYHSKWNQKFSGSQLPRFYTRTLLETWNLGGGVNAKRITRETLFKREGGDNAPLSAILHKISCASIS